MSAALRGFVDTFKHPVVLVILALAETVSLYALAASVAVAFRGSTWWHWVSGIGLVVCVALLGRALRACALVQALRVVVQGQAASTQSMSIALQRGLRLFWLDLLELIALLAIVAASLVAGASLLGARLPLAFALAVAPLVFAALLLFGMFRQATLEIAVLDAPIAQALGRGLAHVLARPAALVGLSLILSLLLLPLQALAFEGPLAVQATCAAAMSLWAYAALARLRWA